MKQLNFCWITPFIYLIRLKPDVPFINEFLVMTEFSDKSSLSLMA